MEKIISDCLNGLRWTNREWLNHLHNGSDKKRYQYCLNSDCFIHYMRAIHGHSGGTKVDPSLLDNFQIPFTWSEYFYHVGSSLDLHATIHSGLIAGGRDTKEGRQTVFFRAVNPFSNSQEEEYQDVSKPRKEHYKNKWKVIQDAKNWINLRKAQDKG